MRKVATRLSACVAMLALAGTAYAQRDVSAAKISADDYVEIQQLYARYAKALDFAEDDGSEYAATFAEDASHPAFDSNVGRKAIAEWVVKNERPPSRGRHIMVHFLVTPVDANTAHVFTYMIRRASGTTEVRSDDVSDDLVVRTPEGWRIKRRSPRPVPPAK